MYAYSWNNPTGGFYAEYAAVPKEKVELIPKRLDLVHTGAMPISGLTALQGIDDVLQLRRDEHILIHGASGGVGTIAIPIASCACVCVGVSPGRSQAGVAAGRARGG